MFQISIFIALLLIGFIFVVVFLIGTSFLFTQGIKELTRRFSLSQTLVGSSILSITTSFPELINAIVAGLYDKFSSTNNNGTQEIYALDSFYNLTGANILQNVFLAAVTLILGINVYKNKQNEAAFLEFNSFILKKKYILWCLIVSETILMLIALIFKSTFTFGGINLIPIICVIIWITYFYISYYGHKEEVELNTNSEKNLFSNLNNKKFFLFAIPLWIFFALLSYANFYLITKLTIELNIPNNVSLGFILGLITSIPEFSSFFFLFKQKNYELATAGLFGSSLFNLCLPLLTNLINPNWFMGNLSGSTHTKLLLWLITDLTINLLLFASTYKVKTKTKPVVISGILLTIYVTSLIGLSFL